MQNGTIYATPTSLNKIIENIALKDNVANFHWTKHLVETHSDSIEENLQCQSLAVQEGWHYSVFNGEANACYFGPNHLLHLWQISVKT